MNLLSRPLVAAVFASLVFLVGFPAVGQRFLPQEIVQADLITPEMQEKIMFAVDPPMFDLTRDEPKAGDVKKAREQIQSLFRASAEPSAAYLEALSKAIESRIQPAVQHKSALVRINAMIVLSQMVDDGSVKWIDKGLEDKNDAVKRWAMQALGRRIIWWNLQGGNGNEIDDAIDTVVKMLGQADPPHPVVVASGLDALFKANTTRSRAELIGLLNKRVAMHEKDADMSYSAESAVIEAFANALAFESPRDMASITGLSRAMYRYASLITGQIQAGRVGGGAEKGAEEMCLQCLEGLRKVVAANVNPPPDFAQARGWIQNDRWEQVKGLVDEWSALLADDPFRLTQVQLAVKEPEE
ncbi:MAG: HEAT repeat domain-containing protein [Planctomycetota bacterium]